jgi:DNA-binding FadR family transcriptional regulator
MPGDRLPNETQLAESFGISRLSVREATKTLEFLGIVESKTGVGLTVGRINMERMTKHLGFHSGLLDADPQQLIDSRVIIETGVLPHVVRLMTDDPSILKKLQSLVDQFRTASFTELCSKPAACSLWLPSTNYWLCFSVDFTMRSRR